MGKKIHLAKKRGQWARQSRARIIRGAPLEYNAALAGRYQSELLKLVREMTTETQAAVIGLFQPQEAQQQFSQDASISGQASSILSRLSSKFMQTFKSRAKRITEKMVTGAASTSRSNLTKSIEQMTGDITLSTDIFTGALSQTLEQATEKAANLIVTIPEKYLDTVKEAVSASISSGNGLADLVPFFEKQDGITERHARNMALDQTRKAYNTINERRMKSAGITKFEWLHSAGGHHPRPYHLHNLNGNVYDLNDPPVIDPKTGERGLPGQLPNCKCRMRPVIELDDGTTT
ncbi:phage head morphogenesis protein [Salmonella enterica subsp. enterica serovar Nigeria]|nr:phage head morphogenesis protein [Salmonella enterica]EBV4427896.1 phage head morphogenesis protein [Salmonella enterica subsp. enterica serovar Nigeria]EBY3138361.1 phage head morphogenesis protein [Salmonella enterica subsp. enterica serovar Nigeria]EIR7537131.1 phage head morphogenesis protein [Salmonella enterica subsp. enterica serovar Durham]EIR7541339.1 phage head morphogenesis protein [Salmonella enterica subsp. enterica serovar Durham]